jgi:hypothetical protein
MPASRLSRRDLVVPTLTDETLRGLLEGAKPRVQESHRFVVDAPLRNSAIALVKKKFATSHPEMTRRLCVHLEKMNKLKKYYLIELILKEYNMSLTFSTLEKDKEEMTYTIDNLDFTPPAELKRSGFFSNLFE